MTSYLSEIPKVDLICLWSCLDAVLSVLATPGLSRMVIKSSSQTVPSLTQLSAVNFLGPNDDWIVSGSDDGHFFVWNKSNGNLHGIYEGDSSVVNVVEGHPYIPLVAVSGIDHTVKVCYSCRIILYMNI